MTQNLYCVMKHKSHRRILYTFSDDHVENPLWEMTVSLVSNYEKNLSGCERGNYLFLYQELTKLFKQMNFGQHSHQDEAQ